MAEHPGIDKISFTGETETGKKILRAAAGTMKRVSMELGGKSPNVVFADADVDAAAKGAINALFYGKGELCSAGSRLLVEESIHDAMLEKVAARRRWFRRTPSQDAARRPRSEKQRENVERYVERESQGRSCRRRQPGTGGWQGAFFEATVFDAVKPDMRIAREEIFRPVLATLTFRGGRSGRGRQLDDLRPPPPWTRRQKAPDGEGPKQGRSGSTRTTTTTPGSLRRLQGVRLRPRARPLRARGVHAGQSVWVDLSEENPPARGRDLRAPRPPIRPQTFRRVGPRNAQKVQEYDRTAISPTESAWLGPKLKDANGALKLAAWRSRLSPSRHSYRGGSRHRRRPRADERWPAWSPTWSLALRSDAAKGGRRRSGRAGRGRAAAAITRPGTDLRPPLSPDGRSIAFLSSRARRGAGR
jgi:hypothetical protein